MEPILLDGSVELDRDLVGGKAWAVNHLRRLGLPVPPAFTLGTDVCRTTLQDGALSAEATKALDVGVRHLQSVLGRSFGGAESPLFVSVRSGAARSMPGMMDTVLNVGTTATTLAALAKEHGAEVADDVGVRFLHLFEKVVGAAPPEDPFEQLLAAAEAVFRSWMSPRATAYRRHHGLPDGGGTAVTVQAMVFGNFDQCSGTGVLFTRNPLSGTCVPLGEWLPLAQGEDVVSGRVTPLPLDALARSMPEIHAELLEAAQRLEADARDVQDVEFTVESGRLWLLQTRSAKRSAEAAVRIAVSMQREGILTTSEAVARLTPGDVAAMLRPRVDPAAAAVATVVAKGEPACPGVGVGLVVGSANEAEDHADAGEDVVLATPTTDPDDVHGMVVARAIVTELGGSTSHAAVVSRELDRPCVVGCGAGFLADLVGREVTVDGGAGIVYEGRLAVVPPASGDDPDLSLLTQWLGVESPAMLPAALGCLAD
ncbi:pyruvate, phosphate dikinase [Candidatus Protofrankia californiensis]|uniref:pyruvate, phosphate dikinase n=1 Tax=Candidatus Protofrankia californiensis TaxID=1839754 RepID=UPI001041A9E8|nr:pyruvate, phosphate dikinase [Candidatus Protofrankia californiensis]